MFKYARINLLKTRKFDVVNEIQEMGFMVSHAPLSNKCEPEPNTIYVDADFDDLLVVPATIATTIRKSKLVTDGKLVFEDKWNYLSVKVLADLALSCGPNPTILDVRAGTGKSSLEVLNFKHVF